MPRKPGRPEIEFTTEHLDEARRLLGVSIYVSRAVSQFSKKFGWGRDVGYRCLDRAKEEVLAGLMQAGSAGDPASACALSLLSVMADAKVPVRERVNAAAALTRLLSTSRRPDANEAGEVEGFLGKLLAQQIVRRQQNPQPPEGQQS